MMATQKTVAELPSANLSGTDERAKSNNNTGTEVGRSGPRAAVRRATSVPSPRLSVPTPPPPRHVLRAAVALVHRWLAKRSAEAATSATRPLHAGEPILLAELRDGVSLATPRFSRTTLECAVEVMIRDGLLAVHPPPRMATWQCAQLAPVDEPHAGRLSQFACLFMTDKFVKRQKRNRTRPGTPAKVSGGVIEYAVWQLQRRLAARFAGTPGHWVSPLVDARVPLKEVLLGMTDDPRSRLSVTEYAAAIRWMIDRGLLVWDGMFVPPATGAATPTANPQVQSILLARRSVDEPEVVRDTVRLTGLLWHLMMCDAEQNRNPSVGQGGHAADGLVSPYELHRATRWLAAQLTARGSNRPRAPSGCRWRT